MKTNRWLQVEVHREEEALKLNIVAHRRGLRWLRRGLLAAAALLVLGVIAVQYERNVALRDMYARLSARAEQLLEERDDLKYRADAFEKEAVEWRHKNGIHDEASEPSPGNPFREP